MKGQLTKEEQINAIKEAMRKINIQNAVHGVPVHKHQDILAFRRITDLRRLGKLMRVKYYGKLPKEDLIREITIAMSDPKMLQLFLDGLDKTGWGFFLNTIAQETLKIDYLFLDFYMTAQIMGLMQSFYHDNQLFVVVPDEVKQTFKVLESNGYVAVKDFHDDLTDEAIAAVNLYGVISQADFVNLFNNHHDRQTQIDEMFSILVQEVRREIGFCFWGNYLVDDEFEEDDFKHVKDLLKERKHKPRYNPPFEEFIKYADWDYYEFTPQMEALQHYIMEWIDDPDDIMDLLDQIHDFCTVEAVPGEYIDLLTEAGVVFDGADQVYRVMQLIVDVQNNTRLWRNHGHTPNELAKTTGHAKIIPFPSNRVSTQVKIGRNDPCPCGSGKKYKNCCGKTI